ncbi:Receptor ligand binding region domain-containing protein [Plasmodiophora brassicae]
MLTATVRVGVVVVGRRGRCLVLDFFQCPCGFLQSLCVSVSSWISLSSVLLGAAASFGNGTWLGMKCCHLVMNPFRSCWEGL